MCMFRFRSPGGHERSAQPPREELLTTRAGAIVPSRLQTTAVRARRMVARGQPLTATTRASYACVTCHDRPCILRFRRGPQSRRNTVIRTTHSASPTAACWQSCNEDCSRCSGKSLTQPTCAGQTRTSLLRFPDAQSAISESRPFDSSSKGTLVKRPARSRRSACLSAGHPRNETQQMSATAGACLREPAPASPGTVPSFKRHKTARHHE